jgi:hypothetical protein
VTPDDALGRFGRSPVGGRNGMDPDKERRILAAWHAR